MAVAPVRVIVPQRMMLSAAVIPERDRVRLPAEARAELGRLDVAEQHGEDRIAFVAAHAENAGGEEAIHEQAFPARDRMRAHHRVLGARIFFAAVVNIITAAIEWLTIVDGAQAIDKLA